MTEKKPKQKVTFFWQILFYLTAALLPFSFATNPFKEIDLSLIRVLIPLTFLFWFFAALKRKTLIIDHRPRFWLFTFFILICSFSIFWAIDTSRSFRKIIFLLSFFPLYFVSYEILKSAKRRVLFYETISKSSLFLALFAIFLFFLQFILGINKTTDIISSSISPFFLGQAFSSTVISNPSWLVNIAGQTILRTFGSFPDPHLFALYSNMVLPLVGYLIFKKNDSFYRWIFFIILFASLLSFSRAAYFSLLIGFIFWIILAKPHHLIKKFPLSSLVFFIGFISLLIISNPLTNRLFSSFNLNEGSNQGRIAMWEKGYETTRENLLSGVGIGNFSRSIKPMATPRDPIYAHNLFLDFSSETGIVNAFILLLITFSPIISHLKKPTPEKLALATTFVFFFIHSLFETPFYSVRVFPLFIILLSIKND